MAHNSPICQGFILCSRQRTDGLGQQLEVTDMEGWLPGLGAEHNTFGLNEIADIEHSVEEVQAFLTDLVQPEKELNLPCAILDMRKR